MKGRLLYIINHLDWFWSHRLALAQAAQTDGWEVYVAAAGAQKDIRLLQQGFLPLELPRNPLGLLLAIRNFQVRLAPDVTHAITLKYAFLTGLACRFAPGKRVVLTIAGLGYLFSAEGRKPKFLRMILRPFLKLALDRRNTKLIFQNGDDQSLLIKAGLVRPERCHLIRGSGVDTDAFPFREDPDEALPLILMPTRLVHDKGISVFIEAARILKARGVKARFQVAGGITADNPRGISEKEIRAMTQDGAVQWLGRITDMPALYAAATLIVYPSWYREGVPKVLLEACATGRAIVTTDHPGCREAVTHRLNGLLVPVKDAEAIADAVQHLLAYPEVRWDMGQAGRRRAEEEFAVAHIVRQTMRLY